MIASPPVIFHDDTGVPSRFELIPTIGPFELRRFRFDKKMLELDTIQGTMLSPIVRRTDRK